MRLGRLFAMGFHEIAGRGRQESAKRLERLGVRGVLDGVAREASSAEEKAALETIRGRGDTCFFEGAVSAVTPALVAARFPDTREQSVAAAERILLGRFDLLGYQGLEFGDPIDWHLDPVMGRRSPLLHWSRIDPLDPGVVGDSKVVWELNRHQWMVSLGQAYRLTEDERYAEAFVTHLRDWIRANPPGTGINWASSLEVALRLMAWSWSLFLFRGSRALTAGFFMEILSAIARHASHVERYPSVYFSPNTHLTGEALGLVYAGVLLPWLPRSRRWRALGSRILVEQIGRQTHPDGVYFEQSTCYQRYTVEIYLQFLILAARNGLEIPPEVGEKVRKMVDVLVALRGPGGEMPAIGDADGGCLLPLVRRSPGDFRGVFSTAAALFGSPEHAWAAEEAAPEALWLLGPEAADAAGALGGTPPRGEASRLFAAGGYAVMRSGWEKDAHRLLVDVGPLGCPVSAGHGHADLLSLQCSAFGEPYLVDPGTYCYSPEPEWRDFFRGTAAHSTVMVDGQDQAMPAGPFAWKSRPRARLRRWISTPSCDLVDAEHDAYRRLADPVIHRRRVLFVKPCYWVVVDDLEGRAPHRVDLRFQFGPMTVSVEDPLWGRARGPAGSELLIRPFASVPLEAAVIEGARGPIQGWTSEDYGRRAPAPVLVYSADGTLPMRIVTLLLPVRRPVAGLPVVAPIPGEGPWPAGLVFEAPREVVRFAAEEFTVERG